MSSKLFSLLILGAAIQACSGQLPKNSSDNPDCPGIDPAACESKETAYYYDAGAHIAARTFAILPEISLKEQQYIYVLALEIFSINRPTSKGPVRINQEKMTWYENIVIESLTTATAKQVAKNLPRPWPVWSPPVIWGAPPPPLPEFVGLRG